MDDQPTAVRLKRVAKGRRPQYFADPATDKLLVMVLELTQELSVTRDRLDTLERLLDRDGVLKASAVETWLPDAEAAAIRAARRDVMIKRIFRASEQEFQEAAGDLNSGDTPSPVQALT